jgi:hypothetical protein
MRIGFHGNTRADRKGDKAEKQGTRKIARG